MLISFEHDNIFVISGHVCLKESLNEYSYFESKYRKRYFRGYILGINCLQQNYIGGHSKTCVKRPLKNRQNKSKYCRMFLLEHSAIFLTCIK